VESQLVRRRSRGHAVALLALASCSYNPSLRDCRIACAGSNCPDGYTCLMGLCRAPNHDDAACGTDVCSRVDEHETAIIGCPDDQVVVSIVFASFGTPTGACMQLAAGACDASTSVAATNENFGGDPCDGTPKALAIEVICD
jgi:hypothetical protein